MEFWRKYNVATEMHIPMLKAGGTAFAVGADWTPAAGDVKISKDGGAAANIATLPVVLVMGGAASWKIALSAAEMSAKKIVVTFADVAIEDNQINILSYGHASAELKPDFSDSVRLGITALPAFAADAAGGLPISDLGGLDLDTKLANTNEITVARMAALTDWINGGRLDLLLDSVLTKLPAALVGGRIDASVGSMAANVLTAASIAASALNGKGNWNIGKTGYTVSALGAGVITASSIAAAALNAKGDWNTVTPNTITPLSQADVRNAIGLAAANLDTQLATLALASALATVDGKIDSIKSITDALGATAAARLKLSAEQIIPFTVDTITNSHTPTVTEFQADDITEATVDHYKDRIVIWTSGALAGQATSINGYSLIGGIGQFTTPAMTEAPANNNTGIIL